MTIQYETAEALCSALYQMPFSEFLGEQEAPEGWVAWFHLGEKPKDMRVSVRRPKDRDEVVVVAEWRNYHADPRNPIRGEQRFTISTYAATQAMVAPATENALQSVLELLRQVVAEEGVAGKIADLQETEETPE